MRLVRWMIRRIQARMRAAHPIPGVPALQRLPRLAEIASRAEKARLAALADRPPLRRSRSTWAPGVQAHADQGTPGSLTILFKPKKKKKKKGSTGTGTRFVLCEI